MLVDGEAQPLQDGLAAARRQINPAKGVNPRRIELDRALPLRRRADLDQMRSLTAAQLQDHTRCCFRAGDGGLRIDAALEAIARIGIDLQFAAGGGDVEGIEQGRFQKHRGCCFRYGSSARHP